jgi:phosphatidylinositol alpha-1,6-mannosyltransferase
VDASKIRIVPNGVDPERFTPEGGCTKFQQNLNASDRSVVLFVGRLIPRKGLNYLIAAAQQVVKLHPQVLFVVAGDGPLRLSLTAEVERLGLSGNFRFLGDVPDLDLPALYRCADVLLFLPFRKGRVLLCWRLKRRASLWLRLT